MGDRDLSRYRIMASYILINNEYIAKLMPTLQSMLEITTVEAVWNWYIKNHLNNIKRFHIKIRIYACMHSVG